MQCARIQINVISFWQHFWTVEVPLCLCFGRNDSLDPRNVYRSSRLEMPSNDVILLGYRPRSEIQASLNLRRALSDDRLLESVREARLQGPVFSMLKLSKTRISVGDSVTVYWDVREQCGANDWIGLFDLGKWACTFHNFRASLPSYVYTRLRNFVRNLSKEANFFLWRKLSVPLDFSSTFSRHIFTYGALWL